MRGNTAADVSEIAKALVVRFSSSSSAHKDAQVCGGGYQLFFGAQGLSLSVVAAREVLIVAEDYQYAGQSCFSKSFQYLGRSLGGRAVQTKAMCTDMRLDRPSELVDVESAYQKGGCHFLAAMPVMMGQDVLGVISLGLPGAVPFTEEHAQTLEVLAAALGPFLHQYLSGTSSTHDTSVFVEDTVAQCLYGCTCGTCGAAETCSASDEEWMDFDFAAYADVMEEDFATHGIGCGPDPLTMDPCTSLESCCSESVASSTLLRSRLMQA